MTKEILIRISGLQMRQGDDEEQLEVINSGTYFLKNNKHYILYDEPVEGFGQVNKNRIKIEPGYVEIIKKGPVTVQLVFDETTKHVTFYQTPYGGMEIGIDTKSVNLKQSEEKIEVTIEYDLEINNEHMAHCEIDMTILAKDSAEFQL
ncbi:DUF1934 domain-containing protein [Eubacterium oxidoreducens]|uniref:Uncharacterized beta-barrel protein YwiB, DUF1934 family n=1 Tax=Eubacterium oxidoreducens TaxID=1732 RepID=A0A1G6BBI9_EUBOX|nr:DUF1934 domain-containing protein [Eubacterium oxidoreducens]SDB17956.1 Uncharacterized beta-barrel protein YwiB, DUF1934 family [Eubacterium oxidoreducens]